jgi:catechol 2,3-dioxygenase-like lactoylglutathione lyase family enzyme
MNNMELKNCMAVLFVKDALKARDFYVGVMGMTVVMNNGDRNFMFKEGFAIWQIMEQNIIPQKLGLDKITNSTLPSRFELCFETKELDNVFQKLKDNGVPFLHEINTELWGQRTIRFYDIDGHLIEVGEAMPIFLRRIYEEENYSLEATSTRTFTPVEILKQILGV